MPNVLIWRDELLLVTQGFVRNQGDNLPTWKPYYAGIAKAKSPLSLDSDFITFGPGPWGQFRRYSWRFTPERSRRLEAFIREHDIDLIHAHWLVDAAHILPTAKRLGIPLVVTTHGYDVREPSTFKLRTRPLLGRRPQVLDYASRIIAVSEFQKRRVEAIGADPAKTVVHYIGIPIEPEPTAAGEPEYDAIFVGRVQDGKGLDDALRAVAGAQDKLGRPVRFVVVGDGDLMPAMKRLDQELGTGAEFVGRQPPSEVNRLMRASRVYIGPSKLAADGWIEALGLVFLEAGMNALPVVSYRSGGVQEAVVDGSTGLLAEEGNVAALTDNLVALLGDPKRAKAMGRAGREHVVNNFDVVVQSRKLDGIYGEALHGAVS
jgi:glycosyltransferase involved in cell wall biosynthesis